MATRTIGTELKLTGEKEFNQQMKAVNAGLKTTKSDMSALTSSFGDNANSMDALRKKQKLLQSSVDQHKAKVDALDKQYKAAAKQYGENSAMAQKYKQDLNNATVALNKETAALEKNADAMKGKLLGALKSVKAGSDKIFSAMGTAAQKSLSGIGAAAKGVGTAVSTAAKVSAAGVAAMTAAGAAALVGVVNMAKESADAAKAASEAGEQLTDSQQRWLAYSQQLDALDGSVANAKGALAGILLPMLGELSAEGGAFLDSFANDMEAAAGDTEKQTQILGQYIANGAKLIMEMLPEYVALGKEILGGVVEGFQESGPDLLNMGLDLLMELLNFIISEAPAFAKAGIDLVLKLLEGINGTDLTGSAIKLISTLVDSIIAAAPALLDAGLAIVMDLLKFIMEEAPALLDAGLELVMQLIEGIDGEQLVNTAIQMVEKLASSLAKSAPELIPAAVKLVMELVLGLAKNTDKLLEGAGMLLLALIDGIIAGLSEIAAVGPEIIEAIMDGIAAAWDGLVSWFNGLWDSLFGGNSVDVDVNANSSGSVDGSHAGGLRYVPYDGYLAELHRGEQVLTAREAEAYRTGKAGGNTVNLTINTQSVSPAEIDMIVEYANRKLGEAM